MAMITVAELAPGEATRLMRMWVAASSIRSVHGVAALLFLSATYAHHNYLLDRVEAIKLSFDLS